jgi:hypothetical protein
LLQSRARSCAPPQNSLRFHHSSRMPNPPALDDELAAWQQALLHEPSLDARAQLLREVTCGRRPQALELLLWWLAQRDVQRAARQDLAATFSALAELGDAHAAPTLLKLCQSAEPSGLHDERAYPITLGQLASETLRRLQRRCPELRELQLGPAAPSAVGAGAASPRPRALQSSAPSASPAQAALQRALRWPHLPLALGLAAPAWAFVMVVAALDAKGHLTPSPAGRHALALLAVLPACFGLFAAARQLLGGMAVTRAQRVSLACGALLSALVLRAFWSDLF